MDTHHHPPQDGNPPRPPTTEGDELLEGLPADLREAIGPRDTSVRPHIQLRHRAAEPEPAAPRPDIRLRPVDAPAPASWTQPADPGTDPRTQLAEPPATAPPAAPWTQPAQPPAPDSVSAPVPVPVPAPEIAPAAEWPAGPETPRGLPPHLGTRPPSYPPKPRGLPSSRAGDLFAAVLADTVVDGAECGAVTVRGVSVRGDSHRWHGECRQDALGVVRLGPVEAGAPGGLLLLAVADGVGSEPRSQQGSHGMICLTAAHLDLAAEALAAALRAADEAAFVALAGRAVFDAAAEFRTLVAEPTTRYATTLRALVVPLDPDVPVRGFLAVGDGGLFRLREGSWSDLDSAGDAADPGGVIDTRTSALPDGVDRLRARLLEASRPGDVLTLCTDGFSLPLAGEAALRDRLADSWGREIPQPADFLWQAQIRMRSYDDDRTVVCLWEGAS